MADDKPMAKSTTPTNSSASDNSLSAEKKKKSIIPKLFSSKKNDKESSEEDMCQSRGNDKNDFDMNATSRTKHMLDPSPAGFRKNLSERHSSPRIEGLDLSNFDQSMGPSTIFQDIRVFVATWNVGGKTPDSGLNLEDFLQLEGSADLYILGFQEIVPLNAGNVLVSEDNAPAARWVALISHTLNKSYHQYSSSSSSSSSPYPPHLSDDSSSNNNSSRNSSHHCFNKQSLKTLSKKLKVDSTAVRLCNCPSESNTRKPRKLSDPASCANNGPFSNSGIEELLELAEIPSPRMTYKLVAKKQMVGIFLSVWARKELVQHVGHLKISCVGRGIMGCLGNKGCISISFTLHQTSFCFVCSHLASGEKEGDEVKRNADVSEILKSTQFPRICKSPNRPIPQKIIGHDRIVWLGDLNYRVSLSYEETRTLLEDNDWDSLLERDQLNMEKEAGRVFWGFNEGKILFAPTYKYSHNSDSYAGEMVKSKKKRRTPAWCDRILWRGSGIDQLSYVRGESRFSDHRPVCAVFSIKVEMINKNKNKNKNSRFRKGYSCTAPKLGFEDCIPQRHSFYD